MIAQIAVETETSPIRTAAMRIAARHPHMAGMAERAADIAENGRIIRLAHSRVFVQSTSGIEYRLDYVPETGGWLCNCPAFVHRPAQIGQRHYCKHILAMHIDNRARAGEGG